LCFVASVSSYAGIWVTTFGPRQGCGSRQWSAAPG
jgi:hypothetical protein